MIGNCRIGTPRDARRKEGNGKNKVCQNETPTTQRMTMPVGQEGRRDPPRMPI